MAKASTASNGPTKTWKTVTKTYEQITGFWTREGVVTGKIMSFVDNKDNPFFVMRLTEEGGTIKDREKGESIGKPGRVVGIPNSAVLADLKPHAGSQTEFRLTSNGKRMNKRGAEYWDITIESSVGDTSDLPF